MTAAQTGAYMREPQMMESIAHTAYGGVFDLEPESPGKKRGRPPKNAVAMTSAERKAASRANQKQKHVDAAREDLIGKLIKIYRSRQAHIISKVQNYRKSARETEGRYLQDLTRLSIEDLRLAFECVEHPDTHGRLSHERRSGDTGIQEIERIAAARERNFYCRRVRPLGAGPDS